MNQYLANHNLLKVTQERKLKVSCSISFIKLNSQFKLPLRKLKVQRTLNSSKNLGKQYHYYYKNLWE